MKKLEIGDKAPKFRRKDPDGNLVSLDDFSGRKVVLFFYPKDNTPSCTAEACNLRDHYALLRSEGFEVIGVSADTEKSHKKFIKKYDLPYLLIADTEKEIINAYGVWGEKKFMGRTFDGIHRITFVIDEKGYIENIIDKVVTKKHTEQILRPDLN